MSRLRWKLFAAMVALVVATIGISALFTRRVTHEQVRRLLIKQPMPAFDEVARALEEHLRSTGGWRDVEPMIDRIATASRVRIVLAALDRAVIAASADLRTAGVAVDEEQVTAVYQRQGRRERLIVRVAPRAIHDAQGRPVAHAYVMPVDSLDNPTADGAIAAVDRRLLAIFAIATVVASLLTMIVSRRIVRPIEQLTGAVQEVGRGKEPARVQVSGRDEIARLATSFNAMADAVATQEELRRRMVGDIAHELRTPLTNLRCELEAIQDGLTRPDEARIASLHEEVLHLQRLVDDLQVLAVAEAGALVLHLEPIDVGAAIERMVGAQAAVTREDDVIALADVTRLRQIVDNLVANALHHTPAGESVRVRVARDGRCAAVSVSDRGAGIAANDLDRIFERFYRVDEARGRERGGAGLGLAIVRQLVELHGGRVWAESVEGEGATFTFTLPLASS